ncbi:hypothetical protein D9M68_487320 [compost metagenome]
MPFQRDPHVLGQQHRILFLLAPFDQRFQHRAQIAHRNVLGHQALHDLGDLLHRHHAQRFFHQVGEAVFHGGQQETRFLDADEVGRVFLQHERQVPRQDLVGIQIGNAGGRQGGGKFGAGPDGGNVGQEPLVRFIRNLQRLQVLFGVAHQHRSGPQLALRYRNFGQQDVVGVLRQRVVEAQLDAGERHTQVEVQGAADLEQLVVQLIGVEAALQVRGNVDHQRQGGRKLGAAVGARLGRGLLAVGRQGGDFGDFAGLLVDHFARAAQQHEADGADHRGQRQKGQGRHARNQAHAHGDRGGDQQRARLGQHLRADVLAHVGGAVAGLHPGHDDARADGDEQRGDLRDEAVADRQDGIDLHRFAGAEVALHGADEDTAKQVHRHDDQPGNGIAFDELHGAVHGAVQLAFLFDDGSALAGLVHVDGAGAQVGVDRHLLAGHGVERKARGHFGHPLGALGDHDELHDGQDQEDDQAHDEVAAHDEITEGFDDVPRVALQQDQAGGGDGNAQAEQRGDQQHGGERRERQRRRQVHGDHQQDG